MLTAMFNDFKSWARVLKDEDGIDYGAKGREVIQVMADKYHDAQVNKDSYGQNKYISGLMLRFWYKIKELKESAATISGLDYADFAQLLFAEIHRACMDAPWRKPGSTVNAQQVINQCIASRIVPALYYEANLQKNKANMNTYSLEMELDEEGRTTLMDTLVDETNLEERRAREGTDFAVSLIQTYINRKKIVEAIILDTIAFNDSSKVTKKVVKETNAEGNEVKYTRYTTEFWRSRCVKLLSALPDNYSEYFRKHYHVVEAELTAALNAIRQANNQKLYKFVDNTLVNAKEACVAI